MTVIDYLNLITSEHRDKPNFEAMISTDVSPMVQVQDLLTSMIPLFDIDTAVGQQLDVIGEWAGFPRTINIAITGIYFSWNDLDESLGWERGIWRDDFAPGAVTVLPDDVYRNFIKAKIASNHWDGTTDGAYAIWDSIFTEVTLLIQDDMDMSYRLAFVGGIIDSLTIAVIVGGYLPLKPEGVRITEYLFPVNDGPLFAWDSSSMWLEGWGDYLIPGDGGSWPEVVLPT